LFWDSCVFNAYLYEETKIYDVDSIQQYIDEAKAGKFKIYTSSIIFAEIATSKIKKKGVGSAIAFMNDLVGACVVIDASVNIIDLAGQLRDIPYRKQNSKNRVLSTGDSIMLATALHLADGYGVEVDTFHTFDDGGKGGVPIISYHEWCDGLTGPKAVLAKRITALARKRPIHPEPRLIK
jgi:predicted nucleic acid-binding protein